MPRAIRWVRRRFGDLTACSDADLLLNLGDNDVDGGVELDAFVRLRGGSNLSLTEFLLSFTC